MPFSGAHAEMSTSTGMLRSAAAVALEVPLISPSSLMGNCAKIARSVADGIEAKRLHRMRRSEVLVTTGKGSQ